MTAAVFLSPGSCEIIERQTPIPPEGSVLVRVAACGVCGTDLHIYRGEFPNARFPLVAGHEFAGVVEAAGPNVPYLRAGDRVAVDPNMPCGACRPCRRGLGHLCPNLAALGVTMDGGFSTHCAVPARQAYKLPKDLPPLVAAMTEPVSCCVHGIERARIRPGDVVAIIGAGMVGLIMTQLARLQGASEVIVSELEVRKREMAVQLGATQALDPRAEDLQAAIARATGGAGADAVIECVGGEGTAQQAVSLVGEAGTVLLFGVAPEAARISVSPYDIYRREVTICGSFTNPHTFAAAIALLQSGRVKVEEMISHRLPLSEVAKGIELLASRQAMKVMVEGEG